MLATVILTALLVGPARTQSGGPSLPPPAPLPGGLRPSGWYSGDTHEHIQLCDDSVISVDDIRARMVAEDLDVASILIWNRMELPFTEFVCNVAPTLPALGANKIIQFGVETSGLSCARWGHLIGLGIGPTQARIRRGSLQDGDCADMGGLGLSGDGTGALNGPVAEHFSTAPDAVCGYAHTIWTRGLYHPDGNPWRDELIASGFTTDALYLDPERHLAVPDLDRLLGLSAPLSAVRAFYPLLGAMDAALGHVQFIETIVTGTTLPIVTSPPAHWNSLYYKLLSAGLRIGLAGGSDRACFPTEEGETPVRTHAFVQGPLTYRAWIQALARGRTSIADGNTLFLRLTIDGREVGSDVQLSSIDPRADVRVIVRSTSPLQDEVELVVGGNVQHSQTVSLLQAGEQVVPFDSLRIDGSSWIAARLKSQRAHTAAVFVIVDGRPVVNPAFAEYWMLWCDLVTKATLDHPELGFFWDQEDEALARIATARRAFKTLRDQSFDPSWGVTRYGRSQPGCRGPITIGTMGPARARTGFQLTCMNAPPDAQGLLVLSHAPLGDAGAAPAFPRSTARTLIQTYPVHSTRSGYAEVLVPPIPGGVPDVHAQFLWENPLECAADDGARHSSSDRLRLLVR